MAKDAISILILDDHPAVLDGIASRLAAEEGLVVSARCATASEALEAVKTVKPQVAVVDVKVQSGFSFDFVEKALKDYPGLKFIFITGHDDDLFVERAFEVGALGFVLKSESLDQLVKAVRQVAEGERYVSEETLKRFPSLAKGDGSVSTRLSMLTPREREILKYVSQGLSAKEISSKLNISTWTVTNHKANIMAKLDIHNQVGLTRFAVSTGLINT
jgi:DNA-binding NarL/FixJ family response regulator